MVISSPDNPEGCFLKKALEKLYDLNQLSKKQGFHDFMNYDFHKKA